MPELTFHAKDWMSDCNVDTDGDWKTFTPKLTDGVAVLTPNTGEVKGHGKFANHIRVKPLDLIFLNDNWALMTLTPDTETFKFQEKKDGQYVKDSEAVTKIEKEWLDNGCVAALYLKHIPALQAIAEVTLAEEKETGEKLHFGGNMSLQFFTGDAVTKEACKEVYLKYLAALEAGERINKSHALHKEISATEGGVGVKIYPLKPSMQGGIENEAETHGFELPDLEAVAEEFTPPDIKETGSGGASGNRAGYSPTQIKEFVAGMLGDAGFTGGNLYEQVSNTLRAKNGGIYLNVVLSVCGRQPVNLLYSSDPYADQGFPGAALAATTESTLNERVQDLEDTLTAVVEEEPTTTESDDYATALDAICGLLPKEVIPSRPKRFKDALLETPEISQWLKLAGELNTNLKSDKEKEVLEAGLESLQLSNILQADVGQMMELITFVKAKKVVSLT